MTKRIGLSLSLIMGLALGAGLLVASASGLKSTSTTGPTSEKASPPLGQTTTLLADGRVLILGGSDGERFLNTAIIRDARTSTDVTLTVGLNRPRAWHTATVLPDGTVLVLGGEGPGGSVVDVPELFDPEGGTFTVLSGSGLTPRAHHTATVLTDGELLVAGGASQSGTPVSTVELYDYRTQTAISLPDVPGLTRKDHKATLLPDGRVLFEGGVGAHDEDVDYSEVFDPEQRTVSIEAYAAKQTGNVEPPVVEASLPQDGAVDIVPDAVIAVRFSASLSVETITSKTMPLEGPQGAVPCKVVAAEEGRLAFITPVDPLLPTTSYSLLVSGPSDHSGAAVPEARINFTTGALTEDDEDWIPNGRNLNGDWRSNRPDSRWRLLPALRAPRGVTALAGQALTLNGQPLANVALVIDGVRVRTDRTGRFLLAPVSAGHHELLIDGRTASKPQKTYGVFEAGVNVIEGETNVLSYTIWMPKIDTLHTVTIPYPTTSEVVVTTPLIPGLELHLPPQTVIYDIDGKPVTQVSITPIPVDRTPFPLPDGVYVPIYFTIQPGGAYVQTWSTSGTRGGRLIYPNYRNEPAGKKASFWHYDPEDKGWYVYGQGTVTPNGKQVVPDPGVAIYEFTGAMISSLGNPPPWWPAWLGWPFDGDPVDLGSGLFVLDKSDLYLPDTLPLVLRRTYRPGDSASRAFGKGSTHMYEMFLWSVNNYQEADLILPDGARIHYVRISSGTGFTDAVYEHTTTPSEFYKSRISWNGNGWDLRLKDGTVYVFGDLAPLQSIRDRYGNTVTITRTNGQSGNITQVTSPNGRWIQFTYDGSNRVTQAKDNIGRTVNYTYDGNGRLSTVTDTKGGVTTYTYDASDRMLTIRDARNIVFLTNEFDANNRVTKQTLADGATFNFSYTLDPNGRVTATEVTDPRGHLRRATFNTAGYPLTDTLASGTPQVQVHSYSLQSGSNLILSATDALSRTTSFTYDSMGNVTGVTRLSNMPNPATTSFTYESTFNQVTSITDPLNHTTTFGRDSSGSLTSVTDPLNSQTVLTYNASGQPLTVRDPLSNTYQFSYDLGDVTSVTDPMGNTTTVFRDAAGRIISRSDALGRVTRYEYDAQNLVTKVTGPLGGQTSFTYDANGNLITVVDERGNSTSYSYDNMDRLLTRTDPLLRAESFQYDLSGNRAKATDRRGKVTTYGYDPLNRPNFVGFGTVVNGGQTTYDSTITATWDGANRLATLVDSLSGSISLSYDNLDHLSSEVTPQGSINYVTDAGDRRTSLTVIGQASVTYAYDEANRPTSITQGTSTVTFGYDANSRRTALTLPNGVLVSYAYDAASRLTGMTYSLGATTLGTLSFTTDQAGRRTQVGGTFARTNLPAAVASASYDAANQLTNWGGSAQTYDSNGNLTSDGTNTYTWDARNQLASIAGGIAASFQYDSLGRRWRKAISGATTDFLYADLTPVQELSAGAPTANLLIGLGIDEYLVRTDSQGQRSLLSDALGSTIGLSDTAGTVQTQYTYGPFGMSATTGQLSSNSFQFTARENDGGIYEYRSRYYNPVTARFISQDPAELASGSVNAYPSVLDDPINFKDPSGRIPIILPIIGIGAGWGAVSGAVTAIGEGGGFWDVLEGAGSGALAGAAATGATAVAALYTPNPFAAGAVGGSVWSLVKSISSGNGMPSVSTVAIDALLGGAAGQLATGLVRFPGGRPDIWASRSASQWGVNSFRTLEQWGMGSLLAFLGDQLRNMFSPQPYGAGNTALGNIMAGRK